MCFVVVLLSYTPLGSKLVTQMACKLHHHNGDVSKLRKTIRTKYFCKFQHFLETTLIFHAWYMYGTLWPHDDRNAPDVMHKRIVKYIKDLQATIPRTTGNGWQLAKIHEFLHLVQYTLRHGDIRNMVASHESVSLSFLRNT